MGGRYYDPRIGRVLNEDLDEADEVGAYVYGVTDQYNFAPNGRMDTDGFPAFAVNSNGSDAHGANGRNDEPWWSWVLGGALLLGGAGLALAGVGTKFGVAMMIGGTSILAGTAMQAAGMDSRMASMATSGLNIAGGAMLLKTPFAPLGAAMMGSGIGSIGVGLTFEALGGNYHTGAFIGSLGGSLVGGQVFKNIYFGHIAKKGIVIGKSKHYDTFAKRIAAGFYDGMPGYKVLSKVMPKHAANLGWKHNKSFINNVMKRGGTIFDHGGPLTGAYSKEVDLVAGYEHLKRLMLFRG